MNPEPTVLETAALPIELYPYMYLCQRLSPENSGGPSGILLHLNYRVFITICGICNCTHHINMPTVNFAETVGSDMIAHFLSRCKSHFQTSKNARKSLASSYSFSPVLYRSFFGQSGCRPPIQGIRDHRWLRRFYPPPWPLQSVG